MMELKVLSYNIHKCIGSDGLYNPGRITRFLQEIDADIIALQEVEVLKEGGGDLLSFISRTNDFEFIPGPTMYFKDSQYGNALLLKKRKYSVHNLDLSYKGREPRGAICLETEIEGNSVQVIATHLGLLPTERRYQVKKILEYIQNSKPAQLRLLCGDLNEWLLWGRPIRWLHRYFKKSATRNTFPVWLPIFALDRVWVSPGKALLDLYPVKNKVTRVASDHYPLMAILDTDKL
jgi:endonuclease/exonuclease/phosphatase family metal-dependent hydrolase